MNDETPDENELLLRVGTGDHSDALLVLYRAWSPQFHRFGLRMLRESGQAEDLVQETFVRLWQSADRFDPARGSARAFAFTIAKRVAIDLLRRAAVRPKLVSTDAVSVSADDEDVADRVAHEFLVRDAIETLSIKHREVIAMSFDQDLPDHQIAGRLGVPVGTIRSRTYYALRALRLELEERGLLA